MNFTSEQNLIIEKMRQKIATSQKIAIFTHIRPDGDTVGSALGLGWALQNAGKSVQWIGRDAPSECTAYIYETYGLPNPFHRHLRTFDCSIVMDVNVLGRINSDYFLSYKKSPDICIDHHISIGDIAEINFIDEDSPATALITAQLFEPLGLTFTPQIASALLMGIVTDTLGFSTSGVTPETLAIASRLTAEGANLPQIIQKSLRNHSFASSKYWAQGLKKATMKHGLVWTSFSAEDRKISAYKPEDDAEMIAYLSATTEAKAAMTFVEHAADNRVKVSWRGKSPLDVSHIASFFGGGGHRAAAGAMVNGSLSEVMSDMIEFTIMKMNEIEDSA